MQLYNIVPFGRFHRIEDAPSGTFPNVKYDDPEEVGGDRKFSTALLGNEVWSKIIMLKVAGPLHCVA